MSTIDKLLVAKVGADTIGGLTAPTQKETAEAQSRHYGSFYGRGRDGEGGGINAPEAQVNPADLFQPVLPQQSAPQPASIQPGSVPMSRQPVPAQPTTASLAQESRSLALTPEDLQNLFPMSVQQPQALFA